MIEKQIRNNNKKYFALILFWQEFRLLSVRSIERQIDIWSISVWHVLVSLIVIVIVICLIVIVQYTIHFVYALYKVRRNWLQTFRNIIDIGLSSD